jgi:HSP20 family protein
MKPAARAPIVDVFEEGATLRIVAELPGVAFENITCTLNEGTLQIETSLPRYSKTVRLPCPVDPASLSQTCRNGILEISLTRAAP